MKQKMGLVTTTPLQRIARPWAIAAGILVVVAGGSIWLFHSSPANQKATYPPIEATLSWPSINTIKLGEVQEGTALRAGEIQIARTGNEFFIYHLPYTSANVGDTIDYHLDVTGKENVQVFFPDSTRTQIAPNSGIHFRSYAADTSIQEKVTYCYGQVLFDVSHRFLTPFEIESPRQKKITVLGTQFAIRDYTQEDTAATFCFNGKVLVKTPNDTQVITAAQRVTVDRTYGLKVSSGDFPAAHWSSPEQFFDFTDVDLDSAMKEIARWYGVTTVLYRTRVDRKKPGTVFVGPISRYISLSQLLAILDRKELHFSIQGAAILVSDK
jgi:transmembrane sensor